MEDWEKRLEDFYFEREKILSDQRVGIDIDDLKEFIQQELDRAREEVIKNLIKKIEEANCDSISLELLREIDLWLSKLNNK